MIKLFKFFKGSAVICAILAPLVMILEVAMDLLQPTLLSNIIDIGVANHDLNYVLITGLKMIIAAIVGLFAGAGCSFLAAIAAFPILINMWTGLPRSVSIGGTSLLIVVGVTIETYKQLESSLMSRDYSINKRTKRRAVR